MRSVWLRAFVPADSCQHLTAFLRQARVMPWRFPLRYLRTPEALSGYLCLSLPFAFLTQDSFDTFMRVGSRCSTTLYGGNGHVIYSSVI